MSSRQLIEAHRLTKIYKDGTKALNSVDLQIEKGQFVVITGISGSGKTTLLNILGLLSLPTNGSYFFLDENVLSLSDSEKAKLRLNKIGFVFQDFELDERMSVQNNIAVPLILKGVKAQEGKKKISEMASKLGITNILKKKAGQISGGQKQRVAIARALINEPEVIFADEPAGNLDSKNHDVIMNIFKSLNSEGKTIIMVTHNMSDISLANHWVSIADGKVKDNVVNSN